MSLTNEEIRKIKLDSNVKRNDKVEKENKVDVKKDASNKTITIIVFTMAILATCCSLYMVALTAFERSVSTNEAWIIAGVAICVALSSHLLPALVKGEKNVRLYAIVTLIWSVSVGATLYSHTLFFVKTQNDMADLRSDNSPEIKNIETLIAQKEKWISEQKNRPINVINSDIANEKIRIEQIKPKVCEKCTTARAKLNSYEIRLTTFEEEKAISLKVEEERNKIREMQEEIIGKKEEKRTDVLFEKLQRIFPSISYEVFNLSLSILSAFLVEVFATFFWWYLFPSRKGIKIEGGKGRPTVIVNDKGQKKLFKQQSNNEIVDAEIVEEDIYLDTGKFEKQKKRELIDFAENIYATKRDGEQKYVMYKNEILPVTKEELFINKSVLSIHKKIIPIKIIKTENIHHVKYVNRIRQRKKIKIETLIIISYVKNIKKSISNNQTDLKIGKEIGQEVPNEKNVRLNYSFEEKHDPIFYQEDYEGKISNENHNESKGIENISLDNEFDISELFNNLNVEKKVEDHIPQKVKVNDNKNIDAKEINELNVIEDLLSETSELKSDVEKLNLSNEDESELIINKNLDPILNNLNHNDGLFKFDIKKPLSFNKKEELLNTSKKVSSKTKKEKEDYIGKFLSTGNSVNSIKKEENRKTTSGVSIMDEVFPDQLVNKKVEEKKEEKDFTNVISEIFNYQSDN